MALSKAAIRAIAIRRAAAKRSPVQTPAPANDINPRLLAMCVDAGGFDQNERFA